MKKSILFIHPFLPYPMQSGGHQALFNGIVAVKDDYDITLVYEATDGEEHRKAVEGLLLKIPNLKLLPLLHPELVEPPLPVYSSKKKIYIKIREAFFWIKQHIKKICDVEDKQPQASVPEIDETSWWKYTVTPTQKDWINHIYKVSHNRHYDIIQIEMPRLIPNIYAMPTDATLIHVHHELGFVRRSLEAKNNVYTPYIDICRQFCDYNEVNQLNMYDAIVSLSEIDRVKLCDAGVYKPTYSSFAVIDTMGEISPISSSSKQLSFIGPKGHPPNYIGIKWFLEKCWYKLKKIDPEYRLNIIGKWDEEGMNEIYEKYSDVYFLGFVDDLYAVIKDSIMIVPITIGSGIRMKILEAASKGIPFISTTIGAEGIPVTSGKNCFLTDDPDEFVADIVNLQDIELCNKFIQAAHEVIEKNFSLAALRENRIHIYNELMSSKTND